MKMHSGKILLIAIVIRKHTEAYFTCERDYCSLRALWASHRNVAKLFQIGQVSD